MAYYVAQLIRSFTTLCQSIFQPDLQQLLSLLPCLSHSTSPNCLQFPRYSCFLFVVQFLIHLLIIYYVPGTVLGIRYSKLTVFFQEIYSIVGETDIQSLLQYNRISATVEEYPSTEERGLNLVWKLREGAQEEMVPKSLFLKDTFIHSIPMSCNFL